jgi:hypothetical protein
MGRGSMATFRHLGVMAGAALLGTVLVLVALTATARAAEPCTSKVMYIAAHADDTLLFQSPDLLRDVRSNHCVQTVFLTAGDAGNPDPSYWEGRETGAEVAYAQMAGVANSWTSSQISVEGHSIHQETLNGQPGISILYMRLPDGGIGGEGSDAFGDQSLLKLWRDGNGGGPSISSIEAVDGSATYAYQGLIDTLEVLMDSYGVRQIATQNYLQSYPGPDHSDHVATADFVQKAHFAYPGAHRLSGYQGYEVSLPAMSPPPQNVFGADLFDKQHVFYAYGKHDEDACTSDSECASTPYAKWLERQYYAAVKETTGVVANAGYMQVTAAGAAVTLNGSQSSAQGGGPLQFVWTQTGGPAVNLSGSGTPSPSFLTPPHPTLLTFSLVVRSGLSSSLPDVVKVRVPSSDPTPVAIAGAGQSVSAGATVGLNGSESWDPNSLPLQYSWGQVDGPSVALSGAATPTPSFTAPAGAATLRFSLTVSNGTQTSGPATVTVDVSAAQSSSPSGTPPSRGGGSSLGSKREPRVRLSRSTVKLKVGKSSRHLVKVLPKQSKVRCVGSLPRGARCRVTGRRDVVVAGSPKLRRAGTFRLWVKVNGPEGFAQRALTVVVGRSNRR